MPETGPFQTQITMRRPRALLIAIAILTAFTRPVTAQVVDSPSDKNVPLPFLPPPAGARVWDLERVAGEVVFAPHGKWYQSATGLSVSVYDAAKTLVATTVSDDTGKFSLAGLSPGDYTLVTGARSLQSLSLAVHIKSVAHDRLSPVPGLMLYLRAAEDKQVSSASAIRDMSLRAEILEMTRKDQEWRNDWIRQGLHERSSTNEPGKGIDASNVARMKEITAHYQWPGPDLVGVDGAEAAFLIVQHAPLAFQELMLPRVERAWRSNELSGQDYALLRDRTLVREGKKQIYGTQGLPLKDWKSGEPGLSPIQDEAHVEQRRAAVGLMPLAEYKAMLKKLYMPKGAPPAEKHQ